MRQALLILACALLTLPASHATSIRTPLPSFSFFVTPKGEPRPFEMQTASPKGSMVFGQGKIAIRANGVVRGSINLTIFSKNARRSRQIKNVPITGRISKPRLARENIETRPSWIYMSADYLVDFTAKTISSPRKKAPIYTVKGVLVYRYRSHLERTGINITNSYDESYLESRVSAFGPNGEVGMVISSD